MHFMWFLIIEIVHGRFDIASSFLIISNPPFIYVNYSSCVSNVSFYTIEIVMRAQQSGFTLRGSSVVMAYVKHGPGIAFALNLHIAKQLAEIRHFQFVETICICCALAIFMLDPIRPFRDSTISALIQFLYVRLGFFIEYI